MKELGAQCQKNEENRKMRKEIFLSIWKKFGNVKGKCMKRMNTYFVVIVEASPP